MARGELIGRVCLVAPAPAVLAAVVVQVLVRIPSEPDGSGSLLLELPGRPLLLVLCVCWLVGLAGLAWAGLAALRTPGASVAPVLVALLVLFMAVLAALFGLAFLT